MKKIVFSIVLLQCFIGAAQQKAPTFIIKHDTITNELSLWKPKKRNPTELKKIKLTEPYRFTTDVGKIENKTLRYNWIDAAKNNHQIVVKAYHQYEPNDVQTKIIKVRKPSSIALSYQKDKGVAPGVLTKLTAAISYDNNTLEYLDDLTTGVFKVVSKGNTITTKGLLIDPNKADSVKTTQVKATYTLNPAISSTIQIPINYAIKQVFDYNGKSGQPGQHGEHGENVTLYVRQKTDSLATILIKTNNTQKKIIANFHKSTIQIATNGGDGGIGNRGFDGERGRRGTDKRRAENGTEGMQGGPGGNGGDGGAVTIYYDASLSLIAMQKFISITNVGGLGAEGGTGGSGGKGGYSSENKSVIEVLFNSNGGNYGKDGANGDNGANGKNGIQPNYLKITKEEINAMFE